MSELFSELLKAQPDVLLMIAGLILIGIGVVGSIKTYIDPGKYGRIAALAICVILLTVGFTLHARELAQPSPTPKPTVMSSICTFDTGSQAGATSQLPETQIASIGSPCQDTSGNKGFVVAPDTPLSSRGSHHASAEAHPAQPAAPVLAQATIPTPASALSSPMTLANSRICTFNQGPLTGKTHELPRAHLQAVGEPCHDLTGNRGFIVAPNTPFTC